MYKQTNNVSN